MSKKKKAKTAARAPAISPMVMRRLREAALFVALPLAIYLVVALGTYDPKDPGWSRLGGTGEVTNLAGAAGAWLADVGYLMFGHLAWLVPLMLIFAGVRIYADRSNLHISAVDLALRLGGFVVALVAGCGLAHLHASGAGLPSGGGGALGDIVASPLAEGAGALGSTLLMLAGFLAGITLSTGLSWIALMDRIGAYTLRGLGFIRGLYDTLRDRWEGRKARARREESRKARAPAQRKSAAPRIEPVVEQVESSDRVKREAQQPLFDTLPGSLPSLNLLDQPKAHKKGFSADSLEAMSRQVEIKLADFGIEVEVVEVHPGPVITRFELQPAPGIKGNKIANLAKDIARGLSVMSVRVVDVIPGKSVIGLEIPNQHREIVYLSEVLSSQPYDKARSPLTLGLGKGISGKPVVADLSKMPHLLVAGTTGSGKSVAINAMILSLLYKATPDQVRMIMVDPKMLELSVYDGLPHLLAPVVTDMKEAANALRWCVAEMERRYKVMAAVGVRNLAGFNKKVKEAADAGQPIMDPLWDEDGAAPGEQPEPLEPLPYVVVVVDEFADMMMIVGKKVEELIARLAQKARASGIHLLLATQRPSVDVITGLIKANIPTRIAFQVSSKVDSRTILDQTGAEQLLGHGDMLYLPPGKPVPERVHGAFVDDHEVHAVVAALKKQGEPDYEEGVLDETQTVFGDQTINASGLPEDDSETDELYDKAVYVVTESRRASISGVQRRLKVGYNRAARMIEDMEAAGIVSAPANNGTREVLAPPPPKA